jgi:hypothetical protein
MQENVTHELLLAFNAHGLPAHSEQSDVLVPQANLRLESRVTALPSNTGGYLVRVDVATHSPVVGSTPIVESFAGFGDTDKSAVTGAFGKFLLGTFHVLIECLAGHSCAENQGEWFEWGDSTQRWNVCCGPVITQSEPEGAPISDQCSAFFTALEPILLSKAAHGSHWIRIFVASFHGSVQSMEVLLDNETWPQAEELARSWDWVAPQSYTSARLFAIALAR